MAKSPCSMLRRRRWLVGCGSGLTFGRGGAAGVLMLLVVAGAGCNSSRKSLDSFFLDRTESVALARAGMEAPQPDERRGALARLANSKYVGDPEIVRTLGLIAVSDNSPAVRAAAVVALGLAATSEACDGSVRLLPEEETPQERMPHASVRAEVLNNLEACAAQGLLSDDAANRARSAGVRMLARDPSRNVRLAAARMLRHFQRREVLVVLISALEQRDFGICHAAERSLEHLTGRRLDHDPVAWRAYLLQTDQPFVVAASSETPVDHGGWFDWLKPKS